MKWKANARRPVRTVAAFQTDMAKATTALSHSPRMGTVNGKPCVLRTHIRDGIQTDEDGGKSVIASETFRKGDYIFPIAYVHVQLGIVGETKDVKLTSRGWAVYLDAVLRDETGAPVKYEGCQIDMSGWYLESSVKDAGLGQNTVRPGNTELSFADVDAARTERARRLTVMGLV